MRVLFWGNYIPLQGIEYIIRAAKLLEGRSDISFEIIGGGQESGSIEALAQELRVGNIQFTERLSIERLPDRIRHADICLGIFGDTDKASRVIPNKVYEAIAMAKPVISGDSPAIRELFADRENILLCRMANAEELAAKILELSGNARLRQDIAKNAHLLYKKRLTPKYVTRPLVERLSRL